MRLGVAPLALVAVLFLVSGLAAQTFQPPTIPAALKEVTASLIASMPEHLPPGALAVLPPGIAPEDSAKVADEARRLWSAALAEACLRGAKGIELTDREHLADVLREQRFALTDLVDPQKAIEIGKIVSARMILTSRLHEFRIEGTRVHAVVEARLVDVQTGQILWTTLHNPVVLPLWAKVAVGAVALLVATIVIRFLSWRWRRRLGEIVPIDIEKLRKDVDGLTRSLPGARDRFNQCGLTDQWQAIQQAWVELEPVLDRIRHALPAGRLDKESLTDLLGASRHLRRIADEVEDLRKAADRVDGSKRDAGDALAQRIAKSSLELRTALDEYRQCLR